MASIWVARLCISAKTAEKIVGLHSISPHDVHDAVVCVRGLTFAWNNHPDRGQRAIVEARIRGRMALIVLYPASDPMGDVWHLGSAYFVEN